MIKKIAKWGILIGAVAGITLAFQNCSPSQFEGSSSTQSSTSGSGNNSSDNSSQDCDTGGGTPPPGGGTTPSETYAVGQLYGACLMQLDGDFKIAHNGMIDSSGNKLSNVPDGIGGATYPVTICPNSGVDTAVRCATGFKPVQTNVTQMDCRSTATAPLCKTYWVTYACAKL